MIPKKINDETTINEKIGLQVRRRRKSLGLTQEKLAERVNVSLTTISRLENGKQMVSVAKLVQITQALETSFDLLLRDIPGVGELTKTEMDVQIKVTIDSYSTNQKKHLLTYMKHCMKDVSI